MFIINEGYHIRSQNALNNERMIWKKVWVSKHWPKVEYFLWLLSHRKILTWENLQKKGMYGPSRCYLCCVAIETIEHILNISSTIQTLWRRLEQLFRKTDRDN